MQEAGIVLNQVVIMFILIAVGYFLSYFHVLNQEGTAQINKLLLYVANPCVMIVSFDRVFSMEELKGLLWAVLLSILVMSIALLVARFSFPARQGLERFAVVFNNCGFMGIPLVQAVLGLEAVFYLTVLMAVWGLYSWTIGIYMLTKDRSLIQPGKVLLNPATISTAIGLLVFLAPVKLPGLLIQPMSYLGNLNTPLAMVMIGSSLSTLPLEKVLASREAWKAAFFRLIVTPLLTLLVFSFLPDSIQEIRMVMLIAACTPTGATIVMFSRLFHQNASQAASIVSLTTLCSLVTIPLILSLAAAVW